MADRLESANQLNEILFQDPIDSFPHRDNYRKITDLIASHASNLEALTAGSPSGAEVLTARDDQANLATAIRKGDEVQGDSITEGVLNDFLVKQSATPDDKVDVDTGEGIISGIKMRVSAVQVVDPPNFSATAKERIDVVEIGSSGTVSTTTGTEVAAGSGLVEIERPPDNTVELAFLFLRGEASSPFAPLPIRNTDNGTDSFIIPNRQRFFVQRDRTDAHRNPVNWVNNGAFNRLDAGALLGWTLTNGALVQETTAANRIFGDFSGKFTGDGVVGGSFLEFALPSPRALRGKFVTASAYLKLDSGTTAKTGRITIAQTGDTPESDFSETADLNDQIFQRIHKTGFIDNSVTAVKIRIELDTTDPSTVAGFIDGVQVQIGLILTEFEYPVRLAVGDDGQPDFQSGDIEFAGNLAWQWTPPFDVFQNVRIFTGT